jgi:hypothetical protein
MGCPDELIQTFLIILIKVHNVNLTHWDFKSAIITLYSLNSYLPGKDRESGSVLSVDPLLP